jgi:uncharacterized protein (TIGR02391 family)
MAINYRLIALQVGDLLKYHATVNEVNRAAQSVFAFQCESFPSDSITSVRAQTVHDWVLSLAKQSMKADVRDSQLTQFLSIISGEEFEDSVAKILKNAGLGNGGLTGMAEDFLARDYHEFVNKHCRKLFVQKNYFHAVFEAAKVYNKLVQEKSKSSKDGRALMLEVLSVSGVIKLTKGVTQTEINIQEGVKFLSAGLMQAMRNPTAHEPALDWPISRADCLDMLSFISYLFRQLENAVYFDAKAND